MKRKILSVLSVLMAVLMALTALAACEKAKNAAGYQLDQPGYDIYAVSGGNTSQTWYTGSEYIFADSDTRYLTSAEVNSLSLKMACYAKNEIYARRGRLFQSSELAEYFINDYEDLAL